MIFTWNYFELSPMLMDYNSTMIEENIELQYKMNEGE